MADFTLFTSAGENAIWKTVTSSHHFSV